MFSQPEKNLEQFHVDPGMSVADLGSGSGFYSLAASTMVGSSGKVYAIEVQKELVDKLQNEARHRNIENIFTIWGDIESPHGTTLADAIVDRVIIANTLFQVLHKEGLLKEARRILKPKGKVLLVDWTDSHGGLGPHPKKVITAKMAREIFEQHGFIFDRSVTVGDHHYGMIFTIAT